MCRIRISKRPRRSISRREPLCATIGRTTTPPLLPGHRPIGRASLPTRPTSSIFAAPPTMISCCHSTLSYQVDVWGRVRRTVESYREQAQASAADLATVNLSMHADLAIDYFQARSLDAEEQLLNSTVKQYEQAVELTRSLYQGGLTSEVDLQQAKTQLETTRAAAIDVGVLRAQYEHAVAILIGKPPAEFNLPPLPLTAPPPHIPVSVPSELLERRPDIAAAERRVAAANAQIGVAKSAYYPVIDLGLAGGFESSGITTLLNGPSGLWSLGASALGTVFDVGRRRALTDQARAGYDSKSLPIARVCWRDSNRWKTTWRR